MVVVDTVDNENVMDKGDVVKCQEEIKILNNDGATSVDDLAKAMNSLTVDPAEEVRERFIGLGLQEKKDDSDKEEDVIVYGDHRDDDIKLIGRGPPGIPTDSQHYLQENSSHVGDLVCSIQRPRVGGKRSHNQPVDPQSKGFKPQDTSDIPVHVNTIAQNQLSGGSVKCAHPRQGKPTVKMLLQEQERKKFEQQQQQQQQLYMMQLQQQQVPQQFAAAANQVPTQQLTPNNPINMGMNIPPETGLFYEAGDAERVPSFSDDDMNAILAQCEQLTQEVDLSALHTEYTSPAPQQTAQPAPETQLRHEGIRRVRNLPSMSESDPRSPESGYHTSSPAPSSPKSPSSRSSFDEEQTLAPEMEERLTLVEEWMKDKEMEEKEKNTLNHAHQQSQPSSWQPEQTPQVSTTIAPVTQPTFMSPVQQATPVGNPPVISTCNPPVLLVGVPNIIPRQVPAPSSSGKGRPPNSSKGRQSGPVRQRVLLPKPAQPQTPVPTIPTTVTTAQTPVQTLNVNSSPLGVVQLPPGQSQAPGQVIYQQQSPSKAEPTKFAPIAPKEDPQNLPRGQDIVKKCSEILDQQEIGDIIKPDPEGDLWLHSYIVFLNENKDVVYMINAIIQRLKREHKESNINIKQVINTPNNKYQTPVYLATVMNNQYVLDWLLKAGGDPNIMAISDAPSGTVRKGPLHYAASRGDECLDVLFGLLECRDTEINLKNTDGLSPLHVAVKAHGKPIPNSTRQINSTRVIEALIQKGANLEEVDDKNGKTPIHNLVESQSYDLISAIFNVIPEADLKKYLRKQDFQKNTALHTAAQCAMSNIDDHKKIIKLLLEKGADPALKNAENHTASMLAYKPHRDELAPLLKSSLGKSMYTAMSPPSNPPAAIKPANKKPVATAVNAPQTYIVVGTLPTTQVVPVQNAVLTTQPITCTIPSANQTLTYTQMPRQSQIVTHNCYTTPVISPQMLPMGSPQVAQSPPQVMSPEMLQAHHDFSVNSPPGPNSPPKPSATTFVNPQQNNVYQQFSNVVH